MLVRDCAQEFRGKDMRNGNGVRAGQNFEPIAIIGMRGRFPGANDLDQYWMNLAKGEIGRAHV